MDQVIKLNHNFQFCKTTMRKLDPMMNSTSFKYPFSKSKGDREAVQLHSLHEKA